jgi:hypothetical protein
MDELFKAMNVDQKMKTKAKAREIFPDGRLDVDLSNSLVGHVLGWARNKMSDLGIWQPFKSQPALPRRFRDFATSSSTWR